MSEQLNTTSTEKEQFVNDVYRRTQNLVCDTVRASFIQNADHGKSKMQNIAQCVNIPVHEDSCNSVMIV